MFSLHILSQLCKESKKEGNMEKLDLDSEILKPMRQRLETTINNLMTFVTQNNREAEITVKLNLNSEHMGNRTDDDEFVEWEEPRIDYQITEKIKESKYTEKGNLGYDYELKLNKETNEVYVEKINKQLSLDEIEEEYEEVEETEDE